MNTTDRSILHIAVPAIVSNITVPLLGLVDVAIVGHLGDAAYIGAIAIGSMIFNVIYWLFGFLRMGTSGMTSQALGRRDMAETLRLLVRSLAIGLAIALLLLAAQVPIRHLALYFMRPAADVSAHAATYFNICVWGAPAMLSLYGLAGWFIGMQNTRTPMLVAILQNVVNIVASLVFVYGLGMKVEGVALGTVVAQWAGLFVAVGLWVRHYGRLWRRHKLTATDAAGGTAALFPMTAMQQFFRVNTDIFLRTLCLVAVTLFFTSAGSWQGENILAANTLLMQFYILFSYFMDGFAYAGEALGGRSFGAANRPLFTTTVRHIFLWGLGVTAAFFLLYLSAGHAFIRLLTDQPQVVRTALPYFPWVLILPPLSAAAFLWDGIFIGTTSTRGMLLSSFVAMLVFFAIYYGGRQLYGIPATTLASTTANHVLWLALVAYLATRGLVQTVLYHRILHHFSTSR